MSVTTCMDELLVELWRRGMGQPTQLTLDASLLAESVGAGWAANVAEPSKNMAVARLTKKGMTMAEVVMDRVGRMPPA